MFEFPNPVNEVAARIVAGVVVVMAVLAIVLDQAWLTLVIAYGFIARTAAGPRLSPLALLVTRVVVPRLPLRERPVAGPPKRFAQAMGAVMSSAAAVLWLGFGSEGAAQIVLGVLIAAASLESFVGFCVGCQIFALLMRAGIVPEEVCERCRDIWVEQHAAG